MSGDLEYCLVISRINIFSGGGISWKLGKDYDEKRTWGAFFDSDLQNSKFLLLFR
jgi:hypothetical protein